MKVVKRAKGTGENKVNFFFFFRILAPAWQGWEHENLSVNLVLTPPCLPAPRCPALLVVGDSSPAVDAVVCRNQPLVSVLNSTVQF